MRGLKHFYRKVASKQILKGVLCASQHLQKSVSQHLHKRVGRKRKKERERAKDVSLVHYDCTQIEVMIKEQPFPLLSGGAGKNVEQP